MRERSNRNSNCRTIPRTRKPKRKRLQTIGNVIIAATMIALLLVVGIITFPSIKEYLEHQEVFRISEVIFRGAEALDESQLQKLIPPVEGANLFSIDLNVIKAKINQYPWVKEAVLSRRLPDELVVEVIPKEPLVLIGTNALWVLDVQGTLLPLNGYQGTLDLPLLKVPIPAKVKSGEVLNDERIHFLLPRLEALQKRLPDLWTLISELWWDDQGQLWAYVSGSRTRILLGERANWQQMVNFYSFLIYQGRHLGMDDIKFVDLRFRRQIIVRRDGTKGQVRLSQANMRQ